MASHIRLSWLLMYGSLFPGGLLSISHYEGISLILIYCLFVDFYSKVLSTLFSKALAFKPDHLVSLESWDHQT